MPENHDNNAAEGTDNGRRNSRFAELVLRHRFTTNLIIHNVLFAAALLVAYLVWFEAAQARSPRALSWLPRYLTHLPFFLAVKSIIFGRMKLFRGWWQYASIRDVVSILIASWRFLAVAYVVVLFAVYIPRWLDQKELFDHSNGVLVLDFLSTVFMVCAARLAVRLYYEEMRPVSGEGVRHVLVVGAGNAGETLLREIYRMRVERYRVVGLVDDDPTKKGTFMHGVPVLGTTDNIKDICEEEKVDEILIAVPSATQKELRRIIEMCRGTKLQFQTLPSMDDLIGGHVTVNQIRQVKIEDLLGREAVNLDSQAVGRLLNNRRVLISGAGGSIGAEMCRQVCMFGPAELILLEQAENGLFEVSNELRRNFPGINLSPVICDIYDRQRVMSVFASYRPEVVVHAAAHKHVPLMEQNACEAVKNNIFGTKNMADASCECGADEFVLISTDKAVNPSSIMGCTKRVAEIYTQALNGQEGCKTQFKSVRFGNVLGSAGSVVPVFERQIRSGGPVTVTHAEMTRYFMTIPEASQLVLQAAANGQGGQIFLLDMGEPVKIVDLARDMITLSGLRVGDDVDIVFTGVRPGEKLFEELRTEGEDLAPTVHPKVKIWRQRPIEWARVQESLEELQSLVNTLDRQEIVAALRKLVSEFHPNAAAEAVASESRQES
jgi:FlaA1/EpsC-like NDP-sugar epimerase